MVTERNYEVKIFEPALSQVSEQDKPLVQAYARVLEPVTAFYRAQQADSLYGKIKDGDKDLPEGWDSPYSILRSNGHHRVVNYADAEPYKSYLREISRRMDEVIGVAYDHHDPEANLIEASLRPRSIALKQGRFAEATILVLNTRVTPRYNLYDGLLDRYLDPRGNKLSMQGWIQAVDNKQGRQFNDIARQMLSDPAKFKVIYGDMLYAGGMTFDRPWSANTSPSEDAIRVTVGADLNLFPNNMDDSTRLMLPRLRQELPQLTQIANWESNMFQARQIGVTAHEAGHAAMPFDGSTIKLLGGQYMAVKELLAELFSVKEISKLTKAVVSSQLKQLLFGGSLVKWKGYVDEFNDEKDSYKKSIVSHYAWAGAWRTNYQLRGGGVILHSDRSMEVPDWYKFVELDAQFYDELVRAINNEKYQRGFVNEVLRLNSRVPNNYMIEESTGNLMAQPA